MLQEVKVKIGLQSQELVSLNTESCYAGVADFVLCRMSSQLLGLVM
jgi:hypothetical protein